MSLGDAKRYLIRQEGDPQRGWITPERLWSMLDQVYADMELIPKHRSHTAYPAGSTVWWGSPARIYVAPRAGIPREGIRPGEPGSLWVSQENTVLKFAADLPVVAPNVWITITHDLSTLDVVVQVRRADTGVVLPTQPVVRIANANTVELGFGVDNYNAGELRIVVLG